jgi:hypothetical protein
LIPQTEAGMGCHSFIKQQQLRFRSKTNDAKTEGSQKGLKEAQRITKGGQQFNDDCIGVWEVNCTLTWRSVLNALSSI